MQDSYIFDNVRHALVWATEHLRTNTFPKISRIYMKESSARTSDSKIKAWAGWREALPTDSEESMLLAMKVYRSVKNLSNDDQELLIMKYWGDYHDKLYLKGALQTKEALRRQGKLMRLNYRFSVRQIAVLKDINYRKVHRELGRIEDELGKNLVERGLTPPPNTPPLSQNSFGYNEGSPLSLVEFKKG